MAGLGSQFRGFKVFRFVFWRLGVMAVNKFPHFPKNRSAVLRSLVSVPLCLGYFVVQPVLFFVQFKKLTRKKTPSGGQKRSVLDPLSTTYRSCPQTRSSKGMPDGLSAFTPSRSLCAFCAFSRLKRFRFKFVHSPLFQNISFLGPVWSGLGPVWSGLVWSGA